MSRSSGWTPSVSWWAAFGARTGGAPIILGLILLVPAFGFSSSVQALFGLMPVPILGVILFLAGVQLTRGGTDLGQHNAERAVTRVTAALSIWNVGLAFVLGLALAGIFRRLRWDQRS